MSIGFKEFFIVSSGSFIAWKSKLVLRTLRLFPEWRYILILGSLALCSKQNISKVKNMETITGLQKKAFTQVLSFWLSASKYLYRLVNVPLARSHSVDLNLQLQRYRWSCQPLQRDRWVSLRSTGRGLQPLWKSGEWAGGNKNLNSSCCWCGGSLSLP